MSKPPRISPTTLLGAATAFSLLGDQTLYSVLPVYYDDLGLSPIQVGLLLSANRWIRLLTNQLAHWATERWRHPKLLLNGALVLGALSTALYTVTWLFSVLLVARLAWGLCWSFIRHVSVLEIMSHTPDHSAGRTMGLYNGVSRVGSIAGLLGGALLVDLFGYVPALLALAGLSLLGLPLSSKGLDVVAAKGASEVSEEPGVFPSSRGSQWTFPVLGFAIGAVGPGFVMATLGAVLTIYAGETAVLSAATLTGALLAVRFVLDSAAAPRLGGLTDRYGVRATSVAFLALGGAALLVATFGAAGIVITVSVITFFVSGTALSSGLGGIVSKLGAAPFARYITAGDFGAAVGPIIGWIALGRWQMATAGLLIGGCVYLAAAGVALVSLPGRQTTRV